MRLQNERQLRNTREKLLRLERSYAEVLADTQEDDVVRSLTLRSLGETIKQLKEEIAWFEIRQVVQS